MFNLKTGWMSNRWSRFRMSVEVTWWGRRFSSRVSVGRSSRWWLRRG